MTANPNAVRVFFGTELRRMRDEASLTGRQLADKLGCTPQWISTMESGRKISEQSALDLDTFFKTNGHFHRIWKLANDIEIQAALPPGFNEYVSYEKKASGIREFSALLISGLYQTEGYARSVLEYFEYDKSADLLERRLERQAILMRDNAPYVWLSLDETVLRRVIGSVEIMRAQLAFLVELSERPNIMINVIPQNVGYHAGLAGSFTVLAFDDGTGVAYTESAGTGMLFEQPPKVASYNVRFDWLRGHTLPVAESRALITAVMEDL